MPPVEVVDLSEESGRIFSRRLRVAVADAVDEGGQVILFLNRRGFATMVVCERCQDTLGCPHCATSLVFHKGRRRTVCHLCGHEAHLPRECPACHRGALQQLGSGTERIEEEAAQAWGDIPRVRVVHGARPTVRRAAPARSPVRDRARCAMKGEAVDGQRSRRARSERSSRLISPFVPACAGWQQARPDGKRRISALWSG